MMPPQGYLQHTGVKGKEPNVAKDPEVAEERPHWEVGTGLSQCHMCSQSYLLYINVYHSASLKKVVHAHKIQKTCYAGAFPSGPFFYTHVNVNIYC
jgi:hypothetical protein